MTRRALLEAGGICKISNGLLEGTNSLIQAAKARARGYRSKTKMITIIYLIAGNSPTRHPT